MRWEVQLNADTGEVLHTAIRRSDVIESIHDGSWFHESFKLWVFLPAGIILAILWGYRPVSMGSAFSLETKEEGKGAELILKIV